MDSEIKKKIYNIDLIVDDIINFPQTYKTILQELYDDGTCQVILRRKLNKLCKEGIVFKTSIPGTRFGKAIFYHNDKKYMIIIESNRISSNVYCFFNSEHISKYYLKIKPYWELIKGRWIKENEKIIFEGNVLKMI